VCSSDLLGMLKFIVPPPGKSNRQRGCGLGEPLGRRPAAKQKGFSHSPGPRARVRPVARSWLGSEGLQSRRPCSGPRLHQAPARTARTMLFECPGPAGDGWLQAQPRRPAGEPQAKIPRKVDDGHAIRRPPAPDMTVDSNAHGGANRVGNRRQIATHGKPLSLRGCAVREAKQRSTWNGSVPTYRQTDLFPFPSSISRRPAAVKRNTLPQDAGRREQRAYGRRPPEKGSRGVLKKT
jgi:hypothetical protein